MSAASQKRFSTSLNARLVNAWYTNSPCLRTLRPLSLLYTQAVCKRRNAYQQGKKPVWKAAVPVIVVGNISMGGTGKTPLVIALVRFLRDKGYTPGVVSRGYGSHAPVYPFIVDQHSRAEEAGDEPLLIAKRANCPVVIAPDRVAATKTLLASSSCDIVISDDGLQHYALARDVEICVVDGQRGLGNQHCLPEGPLREPPQRLKSVDFIVVNGSSAETAGINYGPSPQAMQLIPGDLIALAHTSAARNNVGAKASPKPGDALNAVAGIGNPQRFFALLQRLGYEVEAHAFSDHHAFSAEDFVFERDLPIVMTEKDAVKCSDLSLPAAWYLPVEADLPSIFWDKLTEKLQSIK